MHAAEIDPVTQAATLRLDSIADREEYADLAGYASPDKAAHVTGRTPAPARRRPRLECQTGFGAIASP